MIEPNRYVCVNIVNFDLLFWKFVVHVCYTCTDPVAFKLRIMGITFMPASDNWLYTDLRTM